GVTIRHWFNSQHARSGSPHWTWAVTVAIFIFIAWLSTGALNDSDYDAAAARPLTPAEMRFAQAAHFEEAESIVLGRCSMCHAREPFWDGIRWAPKGVYLETTKDIARHAHEIYLQAGLSHAMPPANITAIEPQERRILIAWYKAAQAK
ncbi:MAG: cysteine desulfurase, partial [Silicimonas sp.]|nr:cysteine desulfurase [Silicimonas sp.]